MHKVFPNPTNNEWINKYNELVHEIKLKEDYYKEYKKHQSKRNDKDTSSYTVNHVNVHHIIPKKVDMSLVKDKDNLLYVPFGIHIDLHYYLWKADYHYGPHLYFLCIAGRKMKLWDLPNGEDDWKQLCEDCALVRKENKNKK